MIESAYLGEDVPLRVEFVDSSGTAIAPTGASDSTGPTVTVTAPDDTEVLSGATMSEQTVGTYENVWDTSSSAAGSGTYDVVVTGEFSGETKIVKDQIRLEA